MNLLKRARGEEEIFGNQTKIWQRGENTDKKIGNREIKVYERSRREKMRKKGGREN